MKMNIKMIQVIKLIFRYDVYSTETYKNPRELFKQDIETSILFNVDSKTLISIYGSVLVESSECFRRHDFGPCKYCNKKDFRFFRDERAHCGWFPLTLAKNEGKDGFLVFFDLIKTSKRSARLPS